VTYRETLKEYQREYLVTCPVLYMYTHCNTPQKETVNATCQVYPRDLQRTTLKDCKGQYLDNQATQHSPCVASLPGQTDRQRNLSASLHNISAYDMRLYILLISLCLEVFLCLEVSEKSLKRLLLLRVSPSRQRGTLSF